MNTTGSGFGVADRGGEQSLGLRGRRRDHDLESGEVCEPGLEALGVVFERPDTTAVRRPDGQRAGEAAPRPTPETGRVLGELGEPLVEERLELDLRDRRHPRRREADPDADDARLPERRVVHPVRVVVGEAVGRAEHPAGDADVLAVQHDRVVPREFLVERLLDRLDDP
jgi:hypothetical protein